MRKYGRVDGTQREIVAAARRLGATWLDLSAVGGGCPDGALGFRGVTYLVEIKTPTGRLTPAQEVFLRTWTGAPVTVLRSVADVLTLLGV